MMNLVPSSGSSASDTYASTSTPEVLLLKEFLARGEEGDRLFRDIYGQLKTNIKSKYRTQRKRCGKAARSSLTGRKPMVILSFDAGLLGKKKSYIDFQLDLVEYVRNGGTLILACLFSGNATPDLHDTMDCPGSMETTIVLPSFGIQLSETCLDLSFTIRLKGRTAWRLYI